MTHTNNQHRTVSDEPVSLGVVEAVADAKGVEPTDLDERLYDCVDPDALDRLFADGTGWDGRLSFTMAGCRVEVEASGTVVVTPLAQDATPTEAATY
jgi:hypothetical protein